LNINELLFTFKIIIWYAFNHSLNTLLMNYQKSLYS